MSLAASFLWTPFTNGGRAGSSNIYTSDATNATQSCSLVILPLVTMSSLGGRGFTTSCCMSLSQFRCHFCQAWPCMGLDPLQSVEPHPSCQASCQSWVV